jgi:glycosyltransferase involved in cell wall biosynthesis
MVNGINAETFLPRSNYRLGIPPKLIFMGRLHPQKDVETLLRALVLASQSDVQALILGDGYLRSSLEQMAVELGVRQRVIFHGRVSDVSPFLQQADLFVLPSLAEGISNALLEAMACGLPCLVSDIAGNRAVIVDGENGFLFSPGSSKALAHLIDTLLSDELLRHRTGQAAQETVIRRFDINRVARDYLVLYSQLRHISKREMVFKQAEDNNHVRH